MFGPVVLVVFGFIFVGLILLGRPRVVSVGSSIAPFGYIRAGLGGLSRGRLACVWRPYLWLPR